MLSSAGSAPTEGRSSWLAVAVLVLAILAFDAWVVWAGPSPGRIAGNPSAGVPFAFRIGYDRVYAPGRMVEGTPAACKGGGAVVTATVPPAGQTLSRHADARSGRGVTIVLAHRRDDSVRIRCLR